MWLVYFPIIYHWIYPNGRFFQSIHEDGMGPIKKAGWSEEPGRINHPWDKGYIYLHGWWIYMGFHEGKYTNRPMDRMGYCQKRSKKPSGEKSDGSIRGQLKRSGPVITSSRCTKWIGMHLQVYSAGILRKTCRPHLPFPPKKVGTKRSLYIWNLLLPGKPPIYQVTRCD